MTCVMVTHDQEEAMTMASRIAVMSEGRFLQVGAPGEIYETPANRFVADFIGNVNLMDGTLVEDEPGHVVVECADCRHYVGHGITGTTWNAGHGGAAAREDPHRPRRAGRAATACRPRFNRVRGTRQATWPISAASRSTTWRCRAAPCSRSARATPSASAAAADLGRRGVGELVDPRAGGADVMTSRALRGRRARARRGDRRSLPLAAGVLPAAVPGGAEDQRLRDGGRDVPATSSPGRTARSPST